MITFAASDGHGGKTRDDLSCGEVNRKPTRGRLLGKNWVKQTCAINNLCKSSYWMIFPGDCFFCFEKNAMTFWASENPVFVLKSGCKSVKIQKLVTSWWLQPIWKICSSNWNHFLRDRGENSKKYLSCHPPRKVSTSTKASGHIRRRRAEWRPRSMF